MFSFILCEDFWNPLYGVGSFGLFEYRVVLLLLHVVSVLSVMFHLLPHRRHYPILLVLLPRCLAWQTLCRVWVSGCVYISLLRFYVEISFHPPRVAIAMMLRLLSPSPLVEGFQPFHPISRKQNLALRLDPSSPTDFNCSVGTTVTCFSCLL